MAESLSSALLAGCTRSRFENRFEMYVIEWTIIESLCVPESNFFEVACSIQKVVKFKGRINVQLPCRHALSSALLAGCTRIRFENSFKMYTIEWTIIESLSVSESNFFEVACSIQKVVKFKGRINVQLPPRPHPGCRSSLCHLHSWQAALEAASRTVLRCTLSNGQLLNHYLSQKVTFLRWRAQFKK